MPEPITKPPRAEQVLAALEARYRPADVVTLAAVVEACGVSQRKAGRVRRWARSVGRWSYLSGRDAWPNWKGDRPAPSYEQCPFDEADLELMDRIRAGGS